MPIRKWLPFIILFPLIAAFLQRSADKPTVYIIGDSTVRNSNRPQCGWGEKFYEFLDTNRIHISNQAMAGRSTRTFIKEKRWERVLSTLKKGDYVIMQFGHNEGSRPDTSRGGYRGVLRGIGEDTVQLRWKDSTLETVHSYGWYLRKFVREAREKGATPVICSMIPRNQFVEGKVRRADKDFGKWAMEIATEENAFFIDLNAITADKYDNMGPDKVKDLFYGDHTHTNEEGARINASSVAEGLQKNPACGLSGFVLADKMNN